MLASASPRRHDLLRTLGVAFEVEEAGVDERHAAATPPIEVTLELAERKARAVAARRPDALVLGADTVVVAPTGEILGKPRDDDDARRMLRLHSGATQQVVTGVALLGPGVRAAEASTTRVSMRALDDAEIDAYIRSGEPFGKAGGYAIQETGDRFVTSIDGSHSNVVGLPLEVVRRLLREAGVPLPAMT